MTAMAAPAGPPIFAYSLDDDLLHYLSPTGSGTHMRWSVCSRLMPAEWMCHQVPYRRVRMCPTCWPANGVLAR